VKRFAAVLFGIFVATGGRAADVAPLPPLPPLTDPATGTTIPGKFVWADYFTSNVEAARIFYAALFGWEWREIATGRGSRYGMFYQDGEPVAGVAYRMAHDSTREYGRWIYYVSVPDVAAAVKSVEARGGRTLLRPRSYPDRGTFAVLADPEGAPFGVLHATAGDPLDYRATIGQWLWTALYTRDAVAATSFYRNIFDYEVREPAPEYDVVDYLLVKESYARAAVAQLSTESEAHPSWLGYVRVDDVAKSAAVAVHLGATELVAPDAKELHGDLAIVADPLGAPVGLLRWTYPDDAAESP
jgi:uncharacterized protein